ncbi:TetR/AcrR family transcriptional regulator [Pseudarthrobacter sp. NamB4]|uniref:TetR/AcrR family transcriptional regulator n=1 Tax=Pseudarthrobacter sp. NamB4 TaxID=2576837 RepID=UPI0010FD10FF|nr:TetR/AcrR family transcriptional regulator [Pseudarthrobacter sp. NamB4]TLM70954.1 TetR/AcrR family transcriptional regulator [Pseudarthrobacter sp. NamB4]
MNDIQGPVAGTVAVSARSGCAPVGARQRIIDAACELFAERGIRDVGIAELISRAGVAKATFYGHFASKDDLVLEFLARCHQDQTLEGIIAETSRRADNPTGRLLAIFDVLDGWFRQEGFQACAFVSTMLEMGVNHPAGEASVDYLAKVRVFIKALAKEACLDRPDEFARSCHILTKGSIISAVEGDQEAAVLAKHMAASLISAHGGAARAPTPLAPARAEGHIF